MDFVDTLYVWLFGSAARLKENRNYKIQNSFLSSFAELFWMFQEYVAEFNRKCVNQNSDRRTLATLNKTGEM